MQIEVVEFHEQGTEGWFKDRLGSVTASRAVHCLKGTKGYYLGSRGDYISDLALERLTGIPTESFTSKDMQWGIEQEPIARSEYEVRAGVMVQLVGFIKHPTIEWFGASPDGLIGENRGLEIKCPKTKNHLSTLRGAPIKRDYLIQCQVGMMCTGRDEWVFESYDPRCPENARMFLKVIKFDKSLAAEIEDEVGKVLIEVEKAVELLGNFRQELV